MSDELVIDAGNIFDSIFGGSGRGSSKSSGKTESKGFANSITAGFTKGLGKFFSKAGVIGVLLNQSLEALNKIKNYLSMSSASFAATMKIWDQAMKLFFKPFGDFLSAILRPLGIALLRLMVKWNKWLDSVIGKTDAEKAADKRIADTEKELGRELTSQEKADINFEEIQKASEDTLNTFNGIGEWWRQIKADFAAKNLFDIIRDIFVGAFDLGLWLGDKLAELVKITFDFGRWLADVMMEWGANLVKETSSWDWVKWLGEVLANVIVGVFDFGIWLKEKIGKFINGVFNFAEWMKEKIVDLFIGVFNFGEWLGTKIGDIIHGTFNLGSWLKDKITSWWKGESSSSNDGYYASGGIVSGRKTITVGERGPEAIIPMDKLNQFGGTGGIRIDSITINNPNLNSNQNMENVVEEIFKMFEDKVRRSSSFGRY